MEGLSCQFSDLERKKKSKSSLTAAEATVRRKPSRRQKLKRRNPALKFSVEVEIEEALRELGMDATIDHVRDFEKIAAYGVMTTPALVVDGQVVSYGKVLKKDEVISILKKVRA